MHEFSLMEAALATAVHDSLATRDAAHRMMTSLWKDAGTLRIVRREPHATNAGKILAVHVVRENAR